MTIRTAGYGLIALVVVAMTVFAVVVVVSDSKRRIIFSPITHRIGPPPPGDPHPGFKLNQEPDVRLAVVGDIGTGDRHSDATAAAVTQLGLSRPFDGLILLGDNVYPDGDPTRLEKVLFTPYSQVLRDQTSLLPVLGNHDYENDNASAQMATLGMPNNWYSVHLGEVLFIGLDSNVDLSGEQRDWLEQTLEDSAERWIIVAMHHPPYSSGIDGSDQDVRRELVPMFEEYGVDLVLSGHDHDYQRSKPINDVVYVVSGAAAKASRTAKTDFTAQAWGVRHFVDLAIWADRIELRAVDQQGRVFDEFTIER